MNYTALQIHATGMTQHDLVLLLYLTPIQLYTVTSIYKPISSREINDNLYRRKLYGVSCVGIVNRDLRPDSDC